ncbi:exported protein of unknown function [Xenorhabdus poinarii G6]|uniref:Uncharacterized protein n=2 Tax=Xenorhabdus poinarii TaxID=40577 RepID=A0A068R1W4_9GAMM|nr:exported protein of unknown function [Xenorhabdus poinarii G6]
MQIIERSHHRYRHRVFKPCIFRLFLRVLITLCLITVICNSAAMAQSDTLQPDKENVVLQHQVIKQKNDKPLLTIAENNSHCEIGSAFCLNINRTQATFSLNLDVLTRSGVRVHPNVLQLARKVE